MTLYSFLLGNIAIELLKLSMNGRYIFAINEYLWPKTSVPLKFFNTITKIAILRTATNRSHVILAWRYTVGNISNEKYADHF